MNYKSYNSFLHESPLFMQLNDLGSFIDNQILEINKSQKFFIDKEKHKEINPLISAHKQFAYTVDRWVEKIEDMLTELTEGLLWKNIQYIISQDIIVRGDDLLRYNEDVNSLLQHLKDTSVNNVEDFLKKNKYEDVGCLLSYRIEEFHKTYKKQFKYLSNFLNKIN